MEKYFLINIFSFELIINCWFIISIVIKSISGAKQQMTNLDHLYDHLVVLPFDIYYQKNSSNQSNLSNGYVPIFIILLEN